MEDPRGKFLEKVSLSESHILPFEGFIFLCGGPVDAKVSDPVSVRDALCRQIAKRPELEKRVRLAEDYKDWSFDGHYSDLLEFEEHIAQLSDLIVLVLESPGSLAELGLFSAIEEIRSKLVVFISTHHYAEESFIRLGPVKYLEDTLNNGAECFPWIKIDLGRPIFDAKEVKNLEEELIQAVIDRLGKDSVSATFSPDIWLHQALLICEFIGLMSALTLTEIHDLLKDAGISVSQTSLKQTLFILQKLELISIEARSSQRFYVSKADKDFIRWKTTDGYLDRGKFIYSVISFYENKDKKRFRALKQARGG